MNNGAIKVLLFGGTGTLSYAVLKEALKLGYSITIFNRGKELVHLPDGVKVIIGDFFNVASLKKVSNENFDVVVDFLSRKPSDIERVYPFFMNKCKQYIFISSACVYRRCKEDFPITEDSIKPNNDWSYNTEKYLCEKLLENYSSIATSYYTIIRPYITYDEKRVPLGLTPSYAFHRTIIERFKKNKPWFVWNGGDIYSTVTYSSDFAVGVVGLFLNEKSKYEDFHIVSDFCYTQNELIEILKEKLHSSSKIVDFSVCELSLFFPNFKSMLVGDRALDAIFNNSKIKNAVPNLNFATSINDGLEKVISYWDCCNKYDYDYRFEGLLDKALGKKGIKTTFVKYPNCRQVDKFIYLSYKYLPIRLAYKLTRRFLK